MHSTTSRRVHVAVATDRAYLPWCATTILSCALTKATSPVTIHVIHGSDLTVEDTVLLSRMVEAYDLELRFYPWSETDAIRLPSKGPGMGGRLSWARVLLPKILGDLERVMYLDTDTLVLQPVDLLWNTELDNLPLAAVSNVTQPAMTPHLASLGITPPDAYFNAGVLLADLGQWRAEGAMESMTELVNSSGPYLWFDQDALNVHFSDRWKRLHPRWNAMNSLWIWRDWARQVFDESVLTEAKEHPGILHFEGPSLAKPWHYLCPHPRREEYRAILDQTPWRGTPLEDRSIGTRFISRLPTERWIPAYIRLDQLRRYAAKARRAIRVDRGRL